MIKNNWQKQINVAGYAQSEFAEIGGVNKGTFSQVCNGQRVLPQDVFMRCAELLGCVPSDIYTWSALGVLYGMRKPKAAPKPRPERVQITDDVKRILDYYVSIGAYKDRAEAANKILCRYAWGAKETPV